MPKRIAKAKFIDSYRSQAIKRGESMQSVNRTVAMLTRTLRDEVVVTV